jgi:hypothetical protein
MPLKERMNYNDPCRDHLGKEYANYREMAEAYGLTRHQLLGRLYTGMDLEKALTMPQACGTVKSCKDHLGKEYHSFQAMAKAYGLPSAMLTKRLNHYGWDLKRALTTPQEMEPNGTKIRCRDHLGNEYPSMTAMGEAYGMPIAALQRRLKDGWELERALTTPVHTKPAVYVDHKGNQYRRQQDLADAYGISTATLSHRLKDGWDLEEALTTPVKGRWG